MKLKLVKNLQAHNSNSNSTKAFLKKYNKLPHSLLMSMINNLIKSSKKSKKCHHLTIYNKI